MYKKHKIMKKTGKILLSLASLFIAGAAIGALYAPDKGARTRRKIVRKSKGVLNSVNNALEDGKDNLEEIRDVLKDNLDRVSHKIQQYS
jgi:gas vesicle protein